MQYSSTQLSLWLSIAILASPAAAEVSAEARRGIIAAAVLGASFIASFILAFLLIRTRRRRSARSAQAAKVLEPNETPTTTTTNYNNNNNNNSSSAFMGANSPSTNGTDYSLSPDVYHQMRMNQMGGQQPPAYPAPVYEAPTSPQHLLVHEMPQPSPKIVQEMPTEMNSPGAIHDYQMVHKQLQHPQR